MHFGLFLTNSAKDVSRLHSSRLPSGSFPFDIFVKNHQELPQKPPGTNGTKANLVVTYAFQGCGGVLEAHVGPSIGFKTEEKGA